MAVYDQSPTAKTPAQTTSTTKDEGAEKKRPTSAEDLVPEENKAARGDQGLAHGGGKCGSEGNAARF